MMSGGDSRCPLCRAALGAPGAKALDVKVCPRCGAQLWVLIGSAGPLFFARQPGQSPFGFLAALASSLSGVPAEEMEASLQSADSLDLVEIIMEIEDGLMSGRCK